MNLHIKYEQDACIVFSDGDETKKVCKLDSETFLEFNERANKALQEIIDKHSKPVFFDVHYYGAPK